MKYYRCHRDGSNKNWFARNDRGDVFKPGQKAYVDGPPHRKAIIVDEEISSIPKGKAEHWLYPEHRNTKCNAE